MIADLIRKSNKAGFHHGTDWVGMIHEGPERIAAEESLVRMTQAYSENLGFILEQILGVEPISPVNFEQCKSLDQCIAWLRGEIKELENL